MIEVEASHLNDSNASYLIAIRITAFAVPEPGVLPVLGLAAALIGRKRRS